MTDFHIIQLNGGKQKEICLMCEKGVLSCKPNIYVS